MQNKDLSNRVKERMTAPGGGGEGPGTSLTWFNQATSDVLQLQATI